MLSCLSSRVRACCQAAAVTMIALAATRSVNALAAGEPPTGGTPSGASTGRVDLRPAFERWHIERRTQGARGTCSVFVVTQALEYAAASAGLAHDRLSVEYLNWASNQAAGDAHDGGFFSDLWKGFAAYGICTEKELPYRDAFDPALKPGDVATEGARAMKDAGLRLHWIKEWDVSTGLTLAHLDEIKRTLRARWPVCGGFRWPKQEEWKNNVLNTPPPEGVRDGHSVLLVGYRDDAAMPGGGVFIFRNSAHGARDGEMTYAYASAYMNDAAWIESTRAPAAKAGASLRTDLLSVLGNAPIGRNRRVSSNMQPDWHTENLDMTWLQPGESVEMPVLEGPGVITHMWFTSHAGWVGELNALSLRIYWDGRKDPAVEAPLGDFFAVGQGKPAVVESMPVQVSPTGALSCSWRMPFAKSARIVVTNDNPDRGTGLYWQVDWTQVDQVPEGTPYFHAQYRQEYPAAAGSDYTLADLRGRGLYVGTVLSVTSAQNGWFGEGDDFFYIDGEAVPSLQGTGSEDYFNDAWGFRSRTGLWFGSPRWQGDSAGDSGVCYRWHLPDPVNFTTSLKVAIEHKGNRAEDTEGFFIERPDFFSSVAFWYQDGDPKPFARMPAWNERRVPWERHHFVRAFRNAKATGDVPVKIDTSGLFGARPMLLWPNTTTGAVLTLPFEVADDGRYAARLTGATGPEYGAYDVEIDGKKAITASLRAAEGAEADLSLGVLTLTKGKHTISFRAAAGAQGSLAVEMLSLLKLPPEATRQVKTHHEAHFVRLGIGRAVYAFRLAYGRLPESLKELVDSGIMAERYLRDENNQPLVSRREGDFLVVESAQGEKWTKRWQGLDARR